MMTLHNPPHPGEVLREYLPADMSVTKVALRIGVSRQAFSKLLSGKAGVSAEIAFRLAAAPTLNSV